MTPRYTKKDAQAAFERLCAILGERPAGSAYDHGAWQLDYASQYGGYQIERIDDETLGVSLPLGARRFSAQGLWWFVHDLTELVHHGLIATASVPFSGSVQSHAIAALHEEVKS